MTDITLPCFHKKDEMLFSSQMKKFFLLKNWLRISEIIIYNYIIIYK